ncbi:3TM-type holin [Microbulbifer sp. JMSA002]|uniref:3TM-type holin n=1 Tax=Microbulbifer sp. JMSA002 TaxID=3243368 RepID=UPI004039F3E2
MYPSHNLELLKISFISNLLGKVIDKAFPGKTEANRLKAQVDSKLISMDLEELRAATQVITAEAGGESWLQRNWRPVTCSHSWG